MQYKNIIVITLGYLVLSSLAGAQQNEKETVTRLTAMAKKPAVILPNDKPRLEFDFGDIKATLNKDGDMTVKGWVSHVRLRCANYSIGLRFGQGEQGCTNVRWLTEEKYLTFQTQCNSAKMEHNGFETGDAEAAQFDQVTCAERLLRCSGVCN